MKNEEVRLLCLSLLHADSEDEVVRILSLRGLWDNDDVWRYYGDREDNYSIIGAQQSRPEAALVEKVVNSVDAVLMSECWTRGLSPEDPQAPQSIHEAVAEYFGGDRARSETLGRIGYWSGQRRTEVSRRITVAATGTRRNPCFTISDSGEGQTPDSMPLTLLDLDHKNKLKIQFVQGKFNMGGTGVLRFCGRRNLQLVVTRRNPELVTVAEGSGPAEMWGFTVVRRQDPPPGWKSSAYTYLAPIGAEYTPGKGGVLRFSTTEFPVFPNGRDPYGKMSTWGTAIKLYEYAASGFRSNMMMPDGLLSRLDILLPEVALPIRLHECRDYKGHTGSFETTLSGLTVRLEDNKAENLEDGFPMTSPMTAAGERMTAKIYAFRKGRGQTYRKTEGLIFTVNGQTHGHISPSFFHKNAVGMGRLGDSILVVVDCSNLSGRAREDLFMNSRDRLCSGELRSDIEHELELAIRDHAGLRSLREKRQREDIEEKLGDSRPLEEALTAILRSSPSLSALFLPGTRLSNPLKTKEAASEQGEYTGELHPTYFKFQKLAYGEELKRQAAINMRCRVTFETNVVNDYFYRSDNRGTFSLRMVTDGIAEDVRSHSLNLHDGKATLNLRLPSDCAVGDICNYEAEVTDDTQLQPFLNRFTIEVGPEQSVGGGTSKPGEPPTRKEGHQREISAQMTLPEVYEVYQEDWLKRTPQFDQYSALQIVQESAGDADGEIGSPVYSFWVNMDNYYLKTEAKSSKLTTDLVKAQFMYGLVLLGMALIQASLAGDAVESEDDPPDGTALDGERTIEELVFQVSADIAPVLLPLVHSLGALTEDDVVSSGGASESD